MYKPKLRKIVAVLLGILLLALWGAVCYAGSPAQAADKGPETAGAAKSESGELDFLASYDLNEGQEQPKPQEPVYLTAVKFILKLALVLALCYGTILLLKKFSGMKGSFGCGSQRIRVVENSSLGPNRMLHLVEVGSKKLLISSTPNQVSLVAEVDVESAPEAQEIAPAQQVPSFKEHLSTFLGNKPDATSSARTVAEMLRDSSSFFQDKVRDVSGLRGRFRRTNND